MSVFQASLRGGEYNLLYIF